MTGGFLLPYRNRKVKKMQVNILGVDYEVLLDADEKDDTRLKKADGYMDHTIKKIVVAKMQPDEDSLADLDVYAKKVLRHEIIHAFLAESGLRESSRKVENWAQNEEMVDWIAIQAPKIFKVFQECGCI